MTVVRGTGRRTSPAKNGGSTWAKTPFIVKNEAAMINLATPKIWLVCGSQHLYGPGPLQQVAAHAQEIANALADSSKLPLKTEFKALLTTPDEIAKLCLAANA